MSDFGDVGSDWETRTVSTPPARSRGGSGKKGGKKKGKGPMTSEKADKRAFNADVVAKNLGDKLYAYSRFVLVKFLRYRAKVKDSQGWVLLDDLPRIKDGKGLRKITLQEAALIAREDIREHGTDEERARYDVAEVDGIAFMRARERNVAGIRKNWTNCSPVRRHWVEKGILVERGSLASSRRNSKDEGILHETASSRKESKEAATQATSPGEDSTASGFVSSAAKEDQTSSDIFNGPQSSPDQSLNTSPDQAEQNDAPDETQRNDAAHGTQQDYEWNGRNDWTNSNSNDWSDWFSKSNDWQSSPNDRNLDSGYQYNDWKKNDSVDGWNSMNDSTDGWKKNNAANGWTNEWDSSANDWNWDEKKTKNTTSSVPDWKEPTEQDHNTSIKDKKHDVSTKCSKDVPSHARNENPDSHEDTSQKTTENGVGLDRPVENSVRVEKPVLDSNLHEGNPGQIEAHHPSSACNQSDMSAWNQSEANPWAANENDWAAKEWNDWAMDARNRSASGWNSFWGSGNDFEKVRGKDSWCTGGKGDWYTRKGDWSTDAHGDWYNKGKRDWSTREDWYGIGNTTYDEYYGYSASSSNAASNTGTSRDGIGGNRSIERGKGKGVDTSIEEGKGKGVDTSIEKGKGAGVDTSIEYVSRKSIDAGKGTPARQPTSSIQVPSSIAEPIQSKWEPRTASYQPTQFAPELVHKEKSSEKGSPIQKGKAEKGKSPEKGNSFQKGKSPDVQSEFFQKGKPIQTGEKGKSSGIQGDFAQKGKPAEKGEKRESPEVQGEIAQKGKSHEVQGEFVQKGKPTEKGEKRKSPELQSEFVQKGKSTEKGEKGKSPEVQGEFGQKGKLIEEGEKRESPEVQAKFAQKGKPTEKSEKRESSEVQGEFAQKGRPTELGEKGNSPEVGGDLVRKGKPTEKGEKGKSPEVKGEFPKKGNPAEAPKVKSLEKEETVVKGNSPDKGFSLDQGSGKGSPFGKGKSIDKGTPRDQDKGKGTPDGKGKVSRKSESGNGSSDGKGKGPLDGKSNVGKPIPVVDYTHGKQKKGGKCIYFSISSTPESESLRRNDKTPEEQAADKLLEQAAEAKLVAQLNTLANPSHRVLHVTHGDSIADSNNVTSPGNCTATPNYITSVGIQNSVGVSQSSHEPNSANTRRSVNTIQSSQATLDSKEPKPDGADRLGKLVLVNKKHVMNSDGTAKVAKPNGGLVDKYEKRALNTFLNFVSRSPWVKKRSKKGPDVLSSNASQLTFGRNVDFLEKKSHFRVVPEDDDRNPLSFPSRDVQLYTVEGGDIGKMQEGKFYFGFNFNDDDNFAKHKEHWFLTKMTDLDRDGTTFSSELFQPKSGNTIKLVQVCNAGIEKGSDIM